MEFDISTIIYILITLVAIIASAFGKKKKPGSSGSTGTGKGFFEKLEEQLGGVFEEAKPAAQAYVEEDVEYDDNPEEQFIASELNQEEEKTIPGFAYEGMYNPEALKNQNLMSGEAIPVNMDSDSLEIEGFEEEGYPDYFEVINDFDLGTAVVYSSIINRKEY